MKVIKFKKPVEFLGRNGRYKAEGLEIWPEIFDDVLVIYPSKPPGMAARCMLQIEKGEPLNQVIDALIEANTAHQDKNIINTAETTKLLGYTQEGLRKLVNKGRLAKLKDGTGKPGYNASEVKKLKLFRKVK